MSPNPWDKFTAKQDAHPVDAPVVEQPASQQDSRGTEPQKTEPLRILTEIDSIISERIASQPQTLEAAEAVATRMTVADFADTEIHRLSLPEYFERFSFDCTRGTKCHSHAHSKTATGTWETSNRGRYVFRWQYKEKRALDFALNVRNWMIANRAYFPDAPHHLFSASGAVEIGDALLTFMPIEVARKLREYPSLRSRELLRSRMTVVRDKEGRPTSKVLMSGDEGREGIYTPSLDSDSAEVGEGSAAQPGALVEGRDFDEQGRMIKHAE